jgi:drug/metabolite transporter (DMT)-like permease
VSPRARGVAELVLAAVLFGVMAYLVKLTTRSLDGAQAAFVRFAVGLAVVIARFAVVRVRPVVVRRDLVFARAFFGGLAVLLYFVTLAHLPVGTATLLTYTQPIFTAFFAAVFLGERPPRARALALLAATVGVVLVILGQGRALGGAYLWQALGLMSAVLAGLAVTAIRAARRTDGSWEVFGAFCVVGMVCTAPFAAASWRPPTTGLWFMLLLVGLVAAAGQVLMTHALAAIEAANAGIISQLTVLTAMGLGVVLDHDVYTPLSIVGAALTLTGVAVASGVGKFLQLSGARRRG